MHKEIKLEISDVDESGFRWVRVDDELREMLASHKNTITGKALGLLEELAMKYDMDHTPFNQIRNIIRYWNNLGLNKQLKDLGYEEIVGLKRGGISDREESPSFNR